MKWGMIRTPHPMSSRMEFLRILPQQTIQSSTTDNNNFNQDDGSNVQDGFALLSDTVIYEKWRRVISRQVRLPSGQIVDFEIVGQSSPNNNNKEKDLQNINDVLDQAVLIFVWHRSTQTTTLIREYMPSVHSKVYGLAAGMVERHKHSVASNDNTTTLYDDDGDDDQRVQLLLALNAAQMELAEECHLQGGEWILLTPTSVTMDKYSTTALWVYLVIDPIPLSTIEQMNRPRDDTEEGIEIVSNMTLSELQYHIDNANITVVGTWACLLAINKLRDMNEIS